MVAVTLVTGVLTPETEMVEGYGDALAASTMVIVLALLNTCVTTVAPVWTAPSGNTADTEPRLAAPSASCTTPVTEPPQTPAGVKVNARVTVPPAGMAP